MSTPMLGLRTTVNKVADLAKAKDWYSDVFQVEPYFDEPFYVGFNVAGYELGLMPDDMPAAEQAVSREPAAEYREDPDAFAAFFPEESLHEPMFLEDCPTNKTVVGAVQKRVRQQAQRSAAALLARRC